MSTIKKIDFKFVFLIFGISLSSSCVSLSSGNSVVGGDGYFADPADFRGVNFKPGQPAVGVPLADALATSDDQDSLKSDFFILEKMPPDIALEVVGFTDSIECSGMSCLDLSLRRAQSVHDWLISRGVPKSRLSTPRGFGSARPVGDNETDEGRARNRRAYISYENHP
ncbi:OmpA family protein [Xanthomonas sp. 1678]|uniref:OmpA family protein n=1 Tax=Xanthomonas sp. 1678 TaxID=3158788 RepID=UPI0028616349|nr:hypothetical protein [Xanthomonas translucens]